MLAVSAALLAGGGSSSAAASDRTAATSAVPGRMLLAPRADDLLTRLPARVALRVPARTTRLWVRLGGRDVTARFRSGGGSMRVADLARRDGLRYGPNRLTVLAERRGGRPLFQARSFVLARRDASLVKLRIRTGAVTSLSVGVAAERRLAAIRRQRTVRVRLNGRPVTRALDRSRPTQWTASLSATHGLRYGVNRLRVLVTEPDRGRYALVRRRFTVRRDRHLAAAGWDVATPVGGRVRLDGRRSRTIQGEPPRHRWTILSKPRAARAALRRAGRARPLLTADRPGRYVVGLKLANRTGRASAAQVSGSDDDVEVLVQPASPLLAYKGLTSQDGKWGIQVGSTFYPNPSPGGPGKYAMQWLTLDRATLTPTRTGNSWFDGSAGGDHGVEALTKAFAGGGLDQLVILSFPRVGTAGPAVPQAQVDAFNKAIEQIGVGPIDAGLLNEQGQKLVIMGVPFGGEGSGWYTHGGGGLPDALTGWLMPDSTVEASSGANRFRFQSERPAFDTSSARTATTNTMTLRGSLGLSASLPAGATGGFQVAIVDPIDFTFGSQATFGVNGVADPVAGLEAMARFINDNSGAAGYHVAVQSIGRVSPPSVPHSPYEDDPGLKAWQKVASALTRFGANPHTFNTVNGAYALLGGPQLDKDEVADSSTTVAIDPNATPPKYEPGTLKGKARPRTDGAFTPVASSASDPFTDSLYSITFSQPTPWPYTKASAEPDAEDYAEALAYISGRLPQLKQWAPNLRNAYRGNDNLVYSDSKTDLVNLAYPGDGRTCNQDPGSNVKPVAFTRAQYCALSTALQLEFDWLDATKTLFDSYEKALNRSGNQQLVDLHTLGEKIRQSVAPTQADEIGLTVFELLRDLGAIASVFGGEAIVVAYEAFWAAYDFAMSLKADLSGAPVGDQITDKVTDVSSQVATRLSSTANALDRIRDVIISDYGRLRTLGQVANGPRWRIDVPTTTSTLTAGANAFFSTELLPVAYRPWKLYASTNFGTPTVDGCNIPGYGHSFRGAAASSWLKWAGDRDAPVWALGKNTWTVSQYAWPPQDLSDQTFLSTGQRGYGLHLERFFWEQYKTPGSSSVACF